MIRYIDTGDQVYPFSDEVETGFSWWDTIYERFLTFYFSQMWDSWEDFEEDFKRAGCVDDIIRGEYDLERFKGLFPYKKGDKK